MGAARTAAESSNGSAVRAAVRRAAWRARTIACLAILWTAGCGGGATPPASDAGTSAPAAAPAPAPAAAAAAVTPKTQGDLFPEGPQKAAVINSCGTCHNLACSVIGQRTADRWDSLQKGHADRVADADVAAMFAYLKANFDSSKPEPTVPPAFLEGGCTPF